MTFFTNQLESKKNIFVEKFLDRNSLVSVNSRIKLEYSRHVPEFSIIPGSYTYDKLILSLEIGFRLLEKWILEIAQIDYPFPYYSCLQISSSWLYQVPYASPPYVILNSKDPEKIKSYITNSENQFPIKVPYWNGKQFSIFSRKLPTLDDDVSISPYINYEIIWRIVIV